MKLWEKTYLIYVNSSIIYWKFIIKVNNQLIWFLLILKIDWVNIAKLYCLQQGKLTKVWDPQHLFPRHIIWISKIFFWETLSMSVFQMFLDFDWQFLHVRKVLLCYKRLLPLKMPFSTLRKLCYSYYAEKRKIRPKHPVERQCSVVIIMSVFYPLETLGNSSKNGRWSEYTRPTDGIYPILWGKKWTRFLAIYS